MYSTGTTLVQMVSVKVYQRYLNMVTMLGVKIRVGSVDNYVMSGVPKDSFRSNIGPYVFYTGIKYTDIKVIEMKFSS